MLQFKTIEKSVHVEVYVTRNHSQIWFNYIRGYNVQKKIYKVYHLLIQESVRSVDHWSDTLITHISIDLNDHSFIIQL